MSLKRFNVSYGIGTSRLPEAFAKVFLTCPECGHRYELRHSFCNMPLDLEFVLTNHKCDFCINNGQEPYASLPIEVTDCPRCGRTCRTMKDINKLRINKTSKISKKGVPPALKDHLQKQCEACGFNAGLEVHHKDWNHNNNNLENLQILCCYCHAQVHKLGKPEFERMLQMVGLEPSLRAALRKSAKDFYNKLLKSKFNT